MTVTETEVKTVVSLCTEEEAGAEEGEDDEVGVYADMGSVDMQGSRGGRLQGQGRQWG